MKLKIYLITTAALVICLMTVPVTTSAAELKISVLNNGGVGTKGTRYCYFSASGQKCKLAVTNESTVQVSVDKSELTGPEESTRYTLENNNCTRNLSLAAAGGVCTVEIKRETAGGSCPQMNSYAIEVNETGAFENHLNTVAFLEMT
jgi:hypothetical protein